MNQSYNPALIPRNPLPEWVSNIKDKTSVTGKRLYEVAPELWYPSVTTVLSASDPEKIIALTAWRAAVGVTAAAARSKEATDRGTTVHDLVDVWLDTFVLNISNDTNKSIKAPALQIVKQLKENLTEIWLNEQAVWSHELKTAGRVDLVGVWNGDPAIIDFKTASKRKTANDIEQYFLQATTYALCWFEITGVLIEDIVIIIGNDNLFKPQVFHRTIYPYITKVQRIFLSYHEANHHP